MLPLNTVSGARGVRVPVAHVQDRLRRLTRLFHIAIALQSESARSLADLAQRCGCSTKTIQRDLSYLAELGVAYHYEAARKAYVLDAPLPFGILDLTLAEATGICLGVAAADGPTSPLTAHALATGLDKVLSALPPEVAAQVRVAQQSLLHRPGPGRDYSRAPFYPLVRACRERVTVEIDYESLSSGRRIRRVDPYAVAWVAGFWMLVAHDHERREVREFALDRVHACHPTQERFSMPKGWSLMRYLATGSVRVLRGEPVAVTVRFDTAVAPLARSYWWPFPHEVDAAPDGSILLRGTVAGLDEITNELLRWGRHVEALEPPELRQRLADEAQAILSLYTRGP